MRRLLYISFLFLAVACVKHGTDGNLGSPVEVNASISRSTSSKALVKGTSFEKNNTIGLFVYLSEAQNGIAEMKDFVSYGAKYKNVQAIYTGVISSPWNYRFGGAGTPFSDIYLVRPDDKDGALAMLAYAPWVSTAQSITSIPFTLGGKESDMPDMMWARQNNHNQELIPDAGLNYRIVPEQGNTINVTFTFRHALSMIQLAFKNKYAQSAPVRVTSVTIRRAAGAESELWGSAEMNAMDGSISKVASVSSLSYNYGDAHEFGSATEYHYVPLLICPHEYKNSGDYVLEFGFGDMAEKLSYPIAMEDVSGGFEPGKVYTFKFTLDNYIQFDGVSISDEWPKHEILLPY